MKNKIKNLFLIILTISIIILTIGITNTSFAAFADYDEETAERETQNMIAEQEKEEHNTIGKSTNNYLSKLNVKGYKITPEFEKQTLEYSIENELNIDSINIEAETEDSRAKVSGIGNVKLQKGENNIRIDVEAESGTVRTYFIKVVTNADSRLNENNVNENAENTVNELLDNSINTSTIETSSSNATKTEASNINKILIVVLILIILIILVAILFRVKKGASKKHKHSK